MTITLIILAAFILYRLADGRPVANIIAAAAITGLFALLDPSLRNLPIMAYASVFAVMLAGFQVIMPTAEAPIRFRRYGNIPALQVGRFAVAMVPAAGL